MYIQSKVKELMSKYESYIQRSPTLKTITMEIPGELNVMLMKPTCTKLDAIKFMEKDLVEEWEEDGLQCLYSIATPGIFHMLLVIEGEEMIAINFVHDELIASLGDEPKRHCYVPDKIGGMTVN